MKKRASRDREQVTEMKKERKGERGKEGKS
jgi:hypothetical protein